MSIGPTNKMMMKKTCGTRKTSLEVHLIFFWFWWWTLFVKSFRFLFVRQKRVNLFPLFLKLKIAIRESLSRKIFSIFPFAKVYLAKFLRFVKSRKFIQTNSRVFWLAKVSLAKVSPIKVEHPKFNTDTTFNEFWFQRVPIFLLLKAIKHAWQIRYFLAFSKILVKCWNLFQWNVLTVGKANFKVWLIFLYNNFLLKIKLVQMAIAQKV